MRRIKPSDRGRAGGLPAYQRPLTHGVQKLCYHEALAVQICDWAELETDWIVRSVRASCEQRLTGGSEGYPYGEEGRDS